MDKKTLTRHYKELKAELSKRRKNIKYFNMDFLTAFVKAQDKKRYNIEHDIDDSYPMEDYPHVKLYHCYDDVYNSKFYQENSCAYCEFLCISHGVIWD